MGSFHNDTLSGSNSAPVEFIEGMAGDDLLLGHGGRDVFRTAAVADGADQIFGGADEDTVDYARRTRPVTASLSDGGADDGEAGEGDEIRQVETARGGSAGDTLRVHPDGTTPATLIGLGGNDTLIGARGGDTVNGGPGRDTVQTFGGNDVIQAATTRPTRWPAARRATPSTPRSAWTS
jgi:Ca2+-binding RTX toxin-like protein